jgi:hypothetical protein
MPAVTAGEPSNKDEYNESFSDNVKIYVSHSIKANRVTISYKRGLFGSLAVNVS